MESGRTSEGCSLTVLGHKRSAHIVYVDTTFQSGFKHGVADAKVADTHGDYIGHPGSGMASHTEEFNLWIYCRMVFGDGTAYTEHFIRRYQCGEFVKRALRFI